MNDRLPGKLEQYIDCAKPNSFVTVPQDNCRSGQSQEIDAEHEKEELELSPIMIQE